MESSSGDESSLSSIASAIRGDDAVPRSGLPGEIGCWPSLPSEDGVGRRGERARVRGERDLDLRGDCDFLEGDMDLLLRGERRGTRGDLCATRGDLVRCLGECDLRTGECERRGRGERDLRELGDRAILEPRGTGDVRL